MSNLYWEQFDQDYLDDMHGVLEREEYDRDDYVDHDDGADDDEEERVYKGCCSQGCSYCLL